MKKLGFWILIALIAIGFLDSAFLTYEHYSLTSVGCPVSPWINCLAVTSSQYSEIFGIPLALLGMIYYIFMLIFLLQKKKMFNQFFLITSAVGVIFSLYLVYIQAFLIKLFCIYCLLSAATSFTIFGISWWYFKKDKVGFWIDIIAYKYKYILKPLLFLIDPEIVHVNMVNFGELVFKNNFISNISKKIFVKKYPRLKQKYFGINFNTPIGLAAGFDYEAKLTQALPLLGFGFGSVGTITNSAYEGNPRPMLGRLPKSKSLMVNKGFKNPGAKAVSEKLSKLKFTYPVGVSIGRTNSADLKTVEDSIKDIVSAFKQFSNPHTDVKNSYFELNISCPNLIHGNVSFYPHKNLNKLLTAIDKLKLKRPVLIKMPIDQTDRQTKVMLKEIAQHKIAGVIFGNLQSDRKNKVLQKDEVKKFKVGKFSGKPTFERSNELIKLAYKSYGDKMLIIGCGGVFNASNAWVKFENGASFVQLITGMIFEGPQLIAQINRDLNIMLEEKGYKNIKNVVGSAIK